MSKRDRDNKDDGELLKLSNDEIMEIVNEIVESTMTVKEKESYFSKLYPDFYDKCPFIFKMACEPNFDKKTFKYMLNMRQKVQDNEITEFEASKEVGQKFFDKYMKK